MAAADVRHPAASLARSLPGRAVDELAYRVGMPGVTRSLVDEVEEDPAKRDARSARVRRVERA